MLHICSAMCNVLLFKCHCFGVIVALKLLQCNGSSVIVAVQLMHCNYYNSIVSDVLPIYMPRVSYNTLVLHVLKTLIALYL